MQIVFFHGRQANNDAADILNLNIKYHVRQGMMDFTNYDSIIAYGETVARKYYPQLKKIADSLNEIQPLPVKAYNAAPIDSIEVGEISYYGNHKMSLIYLDNYFG